MIRSNAENLIRKTLARFVDNEVVPRANEIDQTGEFPRELFEELGRMGVFTIRYPKEKGGAGGNCALFCAICEELARGLMSLAAITAMQSLMGTNFLFRFGSDALKEKYFHPAMRAEKVACFCLTEPEAGSDLGNASTRAVNSGDGFVINGMKTWVTNGPVADFYTVLCQTNPEKKFKGLNFFFVPADTPGLSRGKPFELLGTRNTKICEIAFRDCFVPLDHMLGAEGQGMSNLLSILSEIRIMTAALAVGLQRAALQDSIRYARERTQFGKTIGEFQLIQAKIANMAVDLEASRLLTYKAARMVDDKAACLTEASMAKYLATEAACRAADQATRIFGAYGYSMEYSPQRYYRDSRFLLNGGGTHEILQTNIAKWAGL